MDGQVDQPDFDAFAECFSGPGTPYGWCCIFADFDDDGDVDCDDWAIFVEAWSAPAGAPCSLTCGGCNPAEFNGDGGVGPFDLATLLAACGPCPDELPCPADLNGDGSVGPADLAMLLGSWG